MVERIFCKNDVVGSNPISLLDFFLFITSWCKSSTKDFGSFSMGANPVEVTIICSSIVFTIGLFYYMYMNYKRLFLNWIKKRDPQNKFEFYLQRNNKTLKSHVKKASRFDSLILCNSFSWMRTSIGVMYWADLYTDWLEFYKEWAEKHHKSISYAL